MTEKTRRRSKSTYERIRETRAKIKGTEQKLEQLNQELDDLYKTFSDEFTKQNEIEMRKLFDAVGGKHIKIAELVKFLEK